MKKFYNENRWIVLSLFTLICVSFLLWQFNFGINQDFGLNLFTEIVGVVITVVVIDFLYKFREEQRNIPLKLVVFKDVRLVFRTYLSFFISAYRCSVPKEYPDKVENFLKRDGISLVMKFLNINSIRSGILPERTWLVDLEQTKLNIIKSTETVLNRHGAHLNPDLYNAIHTLNNGRILSQIDFIPALDKFSKTDKNNNSPKNLEFYCIDFSDEELHSLNFLQQWLDKNYTILKKHEEKLHSYTYLNEHMKAQNLECCMPLQIQD